MKPEFKRKALYAAISGTLLSASVLPSLAQAVQATYSVNGINHSEAGLFNAGPIEDIHVFGAITSLINSSTISADTEGENPLIVGGPITQEIALLIKAGVAA